MTATPEESREAFRWLLLPIEVEVEEAAVVAALLELEAIGVDGGEAPAWLDLELAAWRASDKPSKGLKRVVHAYMGVGEDILTEQLTLNYFRLHKRLSAQPLLDHDGASALLSHSRLIALLASRERLSSAQIAKLVAARDTRAPVGWRSVQIILSSLGLKPSLRVASVEALDREDQDLELELFADADDPVCVEIVAGAARRLAFPGDIIVPLQTLLPIDRAPKGPYLQMLHFQCALAEFYDHDLSSLYEFNPRGEVSEWLLARYPSSLEVSKNAFLNLAKSIQVIDEAWANGKDDKAEALALVQIVSGLSSMGFAARRELASWVRRLLVRRIRLAAGTVVDLPDNFTSDEARRLLDRISAEETGTRGILEQRVLDAACFLRHPSPKWIPRGLGDSVNATNVSRKKCGDCDFQDSVERKVVAYEAHAGRLTDIYVQAHMGTLSGVLPQREREWAENVGFDLAWTVDVIFVSHERALSRLPVPRICGDATVEVNAISFRELLQDLDAGSPDVIEALRRYVLDPLSLGRTPDSVRQVLCDLITG